MAEKKYSHEPVEEFDFGDWLRDGVKGFRQKVESCMPPESQNFDASEFRTHMRNAQKEQLLAVRSLIDNAIDWLDKKEPGPKQKA